MARREKEQEVKSSAFTVMYTSLAVLLLAFFILLNSMATFDDERQREALGSLTAVFSGLGTGPLVRRGDSLIEIGKELGLTSEGIGKLLKNKIDNMLSEAGSRGRVECMTEGEDVLLVFADHILFDSGKAILKEGMKQILKVVAGVVLSTKKPVVVEGHTDNRPIHSPRFPSNWELSSARAGAVARYLIEELNLPADKVGCEGHGEFMPIADNTTEEGRAKNRRVVIRFVGLAAEEAQTPNLPATLFEQ